MFLLIDKDSHYNYPELLWKQSAQLLANSWISSLMDWSFFWFAYVWYTTENMLFNNSYVFVPMNVIKFWKFLVFKKKKFIKNLVKPFKFYATKYISKWFRTTFYVTSLILFITKYNAWKRKLKNVYKLLKILAKKHFKKRKNISKKGLTISKPTKKRAKSFFTSKFNWIKHINGEFWARSFIKAVNNFLTRLIVKSNIVGNFDIDLFYLQLFTNSRFLISKKKNFTINAWFLANILIFYAKYFYLYFCGKNFFCNITSILKLRWLNLLLLTWNRWGAIHDTNFLKYVQKWQKLLPLGFDFWVNLVKLILIAYRFILFINLGLFKEIFNFHSILNKISFAFLPIFNWVAEHMDLSLNVYSWHLRGLCYQGLDCLRKLLPRQATDKWLIYFKNIAFWIANSPLIFKRLSLGYMKSYLSVLLCTHSNFLFDDNWLITFLFVSPSFILHKPNVKAIWLQNFTLAVKNMNNLHFSYSVYGLLLKNDWIKLNLPFLIALYFYFFLWFILLF